MKKSFVIIIIILISSCSNNKVNCEVEDINIIKENTKAEISELFKVSLEKYYKSVDNNWETVTWKHRYYIGDETLSERSNRLWRSTGFYEELDKIINSNLEDAKIVLGLESNANKASFRFTEFEDEIEDIDDELYDIYFKKDPNYQTFNQIIKEELTIFIITYIVAFLIALILVQDIMATFIIAMFLEIFVIFGFYMFSSPEDDIWKKTAIQEQVVESKLGVTNITNAMVLKGMSELCN